MIERINGYILLVLFATSTIVIFSCKTYDCTYETSILHQYLLAVNIISFSILFLLNGGSWLINKFRRK